MIGTRGCEDTDSSWPPMVFLTCGEAMAAALSLPLLASRLQEETRGSLAGGLT